MIVEVPKPAKVPTIEAMRVKAESRIRSIFYYIEFVRYSLTTNEQAAVLDTSFLYRFGCVFFT